MKLKKKITTFDDNNKFHCLFATTNEQNLIYLTNRIEHEVIMTDLELNKLTSIGTKGSNNAQFNCPEDICYHNGKIYICDHYNKRIQIFKEDLSFDSLFEIESHPFQIKICQETVCIVASSCVHFYDLPTFTLKYKYSDHAGKLSELSSYFYEYFDVNKKCYVYSKDGDLIQEIQTDGFNNIANDWCDGCLVYFHGKVLISSYSQSKLIVINQQH